MVHRRKTQMKTRIIFCLIILPVITLVSCRPSDSSVGAPTAFPSATPSPVITNTFSPTPSPTRTQIPTSHPSLTPLPTFPADQSEELLSSLMSTNGGCVLPCWWGITPGVSSLRNEKQRLRQFMFLQSESNSQDSMEYSGVDFFYNDEGRIGSVYLLARKGIIIAMQISGFHIIAQNYSIRDMLKGYVDPDEIWIYAWPEPLGEGVLHFVVTLDYSSRGFLVYYFSENGKPIPGTNLNQLCYTRESIPPRIILWDIDSENPFATNNWDRIYEIWDKMRPLEQATGMSKDEFIRWFTTGQELEEYCIKTPASLWEAP